MRIFRFSTGALPILVNVVRFGVQAFLARVQRHHSLTTKSCLDAVIRGGFGTYSTIITIVTTITRTRTQKEQSW